MGMAADVGTLQRLPRIIGDGMMRELAFTGRTIRGDEARSIGLVNRTYADQQALMEGVLELARDIASKSPIAIRGTKEMIRYMRDHRVDDGLEYIATECGHAAVGRYQGCHRRSHEQTEAGLCRLMRHHTFAREAH